MAWSFAGSLASSGISALTSAYSMNKQFQNQLALQQHSYDLTQRGYRESPTNQRLGLEAAGYNPLLAVNNGMSYGSYSAGSAGISTPQISDFGNVINASKQLKLNQKQTESTIAKTNAETAYIGEQERTERERQNVMRLEQDILRIDNALKQKDLDTYDRKFLMFLKKSYSEVLLNNATATANQLNAESNFKNSQTNAFNSMIREKEFNLSSQAFDIDKDYAMLRKRSRERHPVQADWQAYTENWSNAINLFRSR